MSSENNLVDVTILNRPYKIKCPPEQVASLEEAVVYLNTKLSKILHNTSSEEKTINNLERSAIIAALNTAHEFLAEQKENKKKLATLTKKILDLQGKLSLVLNKSAMTNYKNRNV
jgi:cell division protein ZapA